MAYELLFTKILLKLIMSQDLFQVLIAIMLVQSEMIIYGTGLRVMFIINITKFWVNIRHTHVMAASNR
jgi:hypothetical protein